jgi:hypothetical protein
MDENKVSGKFLGSVRTLYDPKRPRVTPCNQNLNRELEQKLWSAIVDFGP